MVITGLNHAVLWVRDAQVSAAFYTEALGFEVVEGDPAGRAVFLRAGGSSNHHDLGVFSVGDQPGPAPHSPGLYHLAWQVPTIEDLAAAEATLRAHGALVGASDHGVVEEPLRQGPRRHRVRGHVAGARRALGDVGDRSLDLPAEVERWSGVATG